MLSQNKDLNNKMKNSLFNISQRMLNSGLNITNTTCNQWLENI